MWLDSTLISRLESDSVVDDDDGYLKGKCVLYGSPYNSHVNN